MIATIATSQKVKQHAWSRVKEESAFPLIAWLPYRSENASSEKEYIKRNIDLLIAKFSRSSTQAHIEIFQKIVTHWKAKLETFIPLIPTRSIVLTADQTDAQIIPIRYECNDMGMEYSDTGWIKLIRKLRFENAYRVAVIKYSQISLYEIKGSEKRKIVDLPINWKNREETIRCFENTVRQIQKNRETPLFACELGRNGMKTEIKMYNKGISAPWRQFQPCRYVTNQQMRNATAIHLLQHLQEDWMEDQICTAKKAGKWIDDFNSIYQALLKNQVSIVNINPENVMYTEKINQCISLILKNSVQVFSSKMYVIGAIQK